MGEVFSRNGVRGFLHHPESPSGDALILTHGAGSNASAPLLSRLASAFAAAGYLTLRYDLPFRQERPKGPPIPARSGFDREGIARAAIEIRGLVPGRLIAGGQSYGGRQTATLAAERPELFDALLLLSYPLHPPGRPEQKRTSFFEDLRVPALFVHGTQDPFGSLEELRDAMSLIPATTDLLAVEGAAHDLRRAAGLSPEILTRLNALIPPR